MPGQTIHRSFAFCVFFTLTASLAVIACRGGSEDRPRGEPVPGQTSFESDDPSFSSAGGPSVDAGATSDTGGTGAVDDAGSDDKGEAVRAIEEADVVQVAKGRLYALSRTGGLSVIDVSQRDTLKMLGKWRPNGQPFEMYVRDDVVLAMVNGFQEWSYDGSSKQTSRVVALDVRDPAKIATVGDFAVPGEVSDSRIVGDVMYVVTFQDGYCYLCDTRPATTVMSLRVGDPRAIAKVDQVTFQSTSGSSWWKRSVSATNTRFWIGGPDYSWSTGNEPHSVIQALDVSDPTGKLTLGASVPVDGLIQSRWQMDEREGVLRVVSQPGGWASAVPTVQTFTIKSSNEVTALGKTPLVLPRPESLMSVRFDGTRAYAITMERTDPLFTIDLSDPAKPVQMGELEMPGWVYFMEPRGNRMLGLGFDQGNPEGAMTVSLFDVSNLATPKMIRRVNFGKGWAQAPEDQDRIHKAFRVLDAEGLIMVPFSSQDWSGKDGTCHGAESGIQLIDWKDDNLTLRGVAKVHGQARRAFLHDERLFAVSDGEVATYDIADRGAPAPKANIPLSTPSHRAVVVGEHVVQLSQDWHTQHARLLVTEKGSIETGVPIGSIDLSAMIADTCGYYYWGGWWGARLYTKGTYVFVLVNTYDPADKGTVTLLGVIDVRDPRKPTLVGKLSLGATSAFAGYDYSYGNWYGGGDAMVSAGDRIVFTGDAFVALRSETNWGPYDGTKSTSTTTNTLGVIDVRDPTHPRAGGSLDLGAWSYGPLQLAGGSRVVTSHREAIGDGKVRFYVDEVDVADTAAPRRSRGINTPGSLLLWDIPSSRAITVDYRRTYAEQDPSVGCPTSGNDVVYNDWEAKTCITIHRTLRLVAVDGVVATLLGGVDLPTANPAVSVADGRVLLRSGGYYGGPQKDSTYVLSGAREGKLALSAPIVLDTGYSGATWASGDRAVLTAGTGKLVVVDTVAARVVRTVETNGYAPYDLAFAGDVAVASFGELGASLVPLR